jgi:hypothetical protein
MSSLLRKAHTRNNLAALGERESNDIFQQEKAFPYDPNGLFKVFTMTVPNLFR